MSNRRSLPRKIKLGDWPFSRLRLQDKSIYSEYVKGTEYNPNVFSSNFDLLWASSCTAYGMVLWKIVDGMLVVFRLYYNRILQIAFLPLGPGSSEQVGEVLYKCAMFCYEWNKKSKRNSVIRVVNHTQLDFLKQTDVFENRFKPVELLGVDRHVGIQNLLELKGRDFKNVRQTINRFRRDYPNVVTRRGGVGDYEKLVKLKEEWNHTMGQKYAKIHDELIYRRILKFQGELNHIVLIAESEGQIIGMITGGILPHGQAWASLHKRKEECYGISEYLYVELAREIHRLDPNVETINLGIDIGAGSGLRNFKEKFRPVLNEERYALYLK